MYIQNSMNSLPSKVLRSQGTEFHQHKETFHDIFQRTLNNKSNSRPSKIELTGILVPLSHSTNQLPPYKFKLETDSKDYFLSMSDELAKAAKKIEWEKVTVKGLLDFEAHVFEVEKISLAQRNDPFDLTTSLADNFFELETYKKIISQKGKLDFDALELASSF